MNLLLDTNVVSELSRKNPDPRLVNWAKQWDEGQLFLSVITIAEVRKGIASLPQGKKRANLDEWLRLGLLDRFSERIFGVTVEIAEMWGLLAAHAKSKGVGFDAMDGLIAATALQHDLTIATRNVSDFSQLCPKIVDPWRQS